jgi:hypothetical protein
VRESVRRYSEVLVLRAAPGLFDLTTRIRIAGWRGRFICWARRASGAAFGAYTEFRRYCRCAWDYRRSVQLRLSQVAAFVASVLLLVNLRRETGIALAFFAASYGVAAIVFWFFCGLPRLTCRDREVFGRHTLRRRIVHVRYGGRAGAPC